MSGRQGSDMRALSVLRNTLDGPVEAASLRLSSENGPVEVVIHETPYAFEVAGILPEISGADDGSSVSREQGRLYLEAIADSLSRASYWQTAWHED